MLTRGEFKLGLALGGVLLLAAAPGCGSSSPAPAADTGPFIGVWSFDQETVHADCGGAVIPDQDLTGKTLTLTQGAAANEVDAMLLEMCNLTFVVSGHTATAKDHQRCTIPVGALTPVIDVTSWTMTTDDGKTMTTDQKGMALSNMCTVTGSGKLTRVSP